MNASSYGEVMYAAQLLVEERYGTLVRQAQYDEDEAYAASVAALRKEQQRLGEL